MRARPLPWLATVLAVALLSACTAPPAPSANPRPVEASDPTGDGVLKVGALVPTSGAFAFLGPGIASGVALAVRDINAAGGVLGQPVEVVQRDSGDAATATAEESLAALAEAGVDVIVGPASSVLAERLLPAVMAAGIPVISPAATLPALTHVYDGGLFFRTVPQHGLQGQALATALAEQGVTSAAIVASDDELGRAVLETFVPAAEGIGITVASVTVAASQTDHGATVAAVNDSSPDAVVLATSYAAQDQTKALIGALIGAGFGGAKLWLTTQNAGDYSQSYPPGTLKGVNALIDGVEPDAAFLAELKSITPALTLARYATEAYDAVVLAALAAVLAGDDGAAAIARTLRAASADGTKCTSYVECLEALRTGTDIDYDGLSGAVDLGERGDVDSGMFSLHAYNDENKTAFARMVRAS